MGIHTLENTESPVFLLKIMYNDKKEIILIFLLLQAILREEKIAKRRVSEWQQQQLS